MLDKIRGLFRSSESEATPAEDAEHDVALAAAMLLLEVAWADHELEDRELNLISVALQDLYAATPDEVDAVISKAREEYETSTGVFPFTNLLKEQLSPSEKQELLVSLWRLNDAERSEFHYEESIIRRIADLIYCTHEQFIAAKIAARS